MTGNHLTLSMVAALMFGLITKGAHAECKQKLADVDAQLAAASLEGVALQQYSMLRNQAEMFCSQGQEALAMQFLTGLEQELPGSPGSSRKSGGAPSGGSIGDEYLAGTWCAMVTQEQAEITFTPEGTYSACFHDSVQGRFGHCSKSASTGQWLSGFKHARVVGPDEFSLGNSVRSTSYKRGRCNEHGI
jgi:hypothetical protein